MKDECNCDTCEKETCCKEEESSCGCEPKEKLVAAKSSTPLVNGYRDEKVIYPLASLQNRIDQIEGALNQNFEMIGKNRYNDFRMTQGKFGQLDILLEDLKIMMESLVVILNVDQNALSQLVTMRRKEIEINKELFEDNKQKRKLVDREATDKDIVRFSFIGKIDGVAFEGGSAGDHHLDLENSNFIPGFAEQLIGTKAGETKDVIVKFPEEYHAENLKGKEAVFTCVIKSVKEKVQQ